MHAIVGTEPKPWFTRLWGALDRVEVGLRTMPRHQANVLVKQQIEAEVGSDLEAL